MTFLHDRPTTRGLTTESKTETGNVLMTSFTDDSGGGGTETLTTGPDVACRIDALGRDEGEVAERLSDRSTHLVTLPANTAVTTADDFQIDGLGTFEVLAVRDHTDELDRFIEVVSKS